MIWLKNVGFVCENIKKMNILVKFSNFPLQCNRVSQIYKMSFTLQMQQSESKNLRMENTLQSKMHKINEYS